MWLAATLGRRPSLNQMSAFGPKQTCASGLHMSAFGIKPDIAPIQGFRPILWRRCGLTAKATALRLTYFWNAPVPSLQVAYGLLLFQLPMELLGAM